MIGYLDIWDFVQNNPVGDESTMKQAWPWVVNCWSQVIHYILLSYMFDSYHKKNLKRQEGNMKWDDRKREGKLTSAYCMSGICTFKWSFNLIHFPNFISRFTDEGKFRTVKWLVQGQEALWYILKSLQLSGQIELDSNPAAAIYQYDFGQIN